MPTKIDWKKLIKPAIAVIAALATLYGIISMVQLHGIGAYRIGTDAGAVFAASYEWVLAIAGILWLALLVLVAKSWLDNGGWEKLRQLQQKRRRARRAKAKARKAAESGSPVEQQDSAVEGEVKPEVSRKRIQQEKQDVPGTPSGKRPAPAGSPPVKKPAQPDAVPAKKTAPAETAPEKKPAPKAGQDEWLAKPSGEKSEYPVLAEDDGFENTLLGKVPGVKQILEKKRERQDEAEDADITPPEQPPVPQGKPEPSEKPESKIPVLGESQPEDIPDVPILKTCPACGAMLRPGAKFCVSCGKKLGE